MGVIRGRCPFCAKGYKTTAENLGKTGRCRKCGQPFEVEAGDLDASEGSLEFSAAPEPGIEGECPVCQAGYFAQAKDLGKAAQCGSCRANITVAPAQRKRKASLAEQWKSRRAEMEDGTLQNTVATRFSTAEPPLKLADQSEPPESRPRKKKGRKPKREGPQLGAPLFLTRPLNHPGVAAVLAVVPGLGFLYSGRFLKALLWFLAFFIVLWFFELFGFLALMFGAAVDGGRPRETSLLFFLIFVLAIFVAYLFQIMDSYRAAESENRKILAAHGYAQR